MTNCFLYNRMLILASLHLTVTCLLAGSSCLQHAVPARCPIYPTPRGHAGLALRGHNSSSLTSWVRTDFWTSDNGALQACWCCTRRSSANHATCTGLSNATSISACSSGTRASSTSYKSAGTGRSSAAADTNFTVTNDRFQLTCF